MCTASFMMVALACIFTTRPEGNWRIFRLQLHGFLCLRLWPVIDVRSGAVAGAQCTHGRLNWIIGRGDPPLRLSQRTARARLGWRLGCERRHRPNPSKSHQQPRGGAVVTRRAIALVLSTHTHRVAKSKVGRRLLADACLTCRYRDHCFVWTSVECCGEIKGRKGLSSALV